MNTHTHIFIYTHKRTLLGFRAKFGLTTAEQRNPNFQITYNSTHECLWNGPSWPYATSVTLTAVANVLNEPNLKPVKDQFTFNNETEENSRMRYVNDNENENENKRTEEYEDSKKNIFGEKVSLKNIPQYITKEDYFNMLKTYALSHRRRKTKEEITKEKEEEEERELLSKDKVDGEKVENKVVFWIDENLNPFTG